MSKSKVVFASIAIAAGSLITQPITNAGATPIGVVQFSSGSSNLNNTAKGILSAISKKIAKTDSVTLTGYLRNHSNQDSSIGLSRANAVKNYLVSIGVKASIKTVNGGVPKIGGSLASANQVVVDVKKKSSTSPGSFKVTFNLNGKKLDVGTAPPAQTATKTKPVVTKPMGYWGSGTTYSPNGDWQLEDWSATPTGPAIKWTLHPNVAWEYKPTKNTTLYAKWKLTEFFFYGRIGAINLNTEPLERYRILTGNPETGLTSDTNPFNINLGGNAARINASLFPILDAPVKANMKFVFPDHGRGIANDYSIYFDSSQSSLGTPFDFSTVPGSFVHDEVNHLNYYYYWYQPSTTQQTYLKVIDNRLIS